MTLAAVLALALAAEPGNVAALDEKNGFRDLQFGASLGEVKGLVKMGKDSGFDVYTRSTDKKAIGAAALSKIAYGFIEGKLAAVLIESKGKANADALLKTLQAAYGDGDQPNEFLQEFRWVGSRVLMTFKANMFSGDATLAIVSIPLVLEMQAKDAERAAEAKSDL